METQDKTLLETWYANVLAKFPKGNDNDNIQIDEDVEDVDVYSVARTIVKAIVIAKQKGMLSEEMERSTQNPQDLAILATQGAVIIDAAVGLATGRISSWEQLATRYIDYTHTVAVTLVDFVAGPVVDTAEHFVAVAAEGVGQFFGQPSWGQYVDMIYQAYYPNVVNGFKSVCVRALEKVKEWRHSLKNYLLDLFSETGEEERLPSGENVVQSNRQRQKEVALLQ